MGTWRDVARPIIARVLEENRGAELKVLRRKLLEVYPFGLKQYHPYKIWLSEIKLQLNPGKRRPTHRPAAGQKDLFAV